MFSKQEAIKKAELIIQEKQQKTKYDDFSAVSISTENPFFWMFVSGSERMFNDGFVPGAFFVTVDKKDGHIWTRTEMENFITRQPELQAA